MFLLPVLFFEVVSWRNPLLVTAFELGLRYAPSGYRQKLLSALRSAGDSITDASGAITWLYDVESAPYNIPSFRHWHFRQEAINESITDFPVHENQDDVRSAISDLERNLLAAAMTKPWPFAFAIKSLLTLACDIHSPFHVTEYFSPEFPNGDTNGQLFRVQYKGRVTSLFDVWEEGCGAIDGLDINTTVDALIAKYQNEYQGSVDWDAVLEETAALTKTNGYAGVSVGKVLDEAYVKKCQEVTLKQIARAGYALGNLMQRISVPAFEDSELLPRARASESIAWTLVCFLLPMAALTVYHRFCHGK